MPTITIDGRQVEVEASATIMQAAEKLGIEIPHFCYHPGLSISGNCRMCLVEVEGAPKLQASCCSPIRDGMVVNTSTPKVIEARKGVMEFLLINHPLDCPICDQSGECRLQDYSHEHGQPHSRYNEEKRRYSRENIGSKLVRDMNRCIACTRCVRFFHDVLGLDEYNVYERGNKTTVGAYGDHELDSKFVGNAAEICPVGALTTRDFRFKKRVWFLESADSVCPTCAAGCNIVIDHKDGKIYRYRTRPNPAVNQWWICDEGRFGFHRLNDESLRLKKPLVKKDGKLTPVSWSEAFAHIGQRVRELCGDENPAPVLAVGSAHCANEDNFMLRAFARNCLRSATVRFKSFPAPWDEVPMERNHEDLFIEPDKSPNQRGARSLGLEPDPGLETSWTEIVENKYKILYLMGTDLFKGNPAGERDPGALDSVGLVVVQDIYLGRTAQAADVVLPALAFSERYGHFTNINGSVQEYFAGPQPLSASALPDWEILSRLGEAMGGDYPYRSHREVPWRAEYNDPETE